MNKHGIFENINMQEGDFVTRILFLWSKLQKFPIQEKGQLRNLMTCFTNQTRQN